LLHPMLGEEPFQQVDEPGRSDFQNWFSKQMLDEIKMLTFNSGTVPNGLER